MPVSLTPFAILVATTPSPGSRSSGGGSGFTAFIPILLIFLLGYFLLVRPARNRQRKAMESRSAVEPGVEVTTTAGLLATVVDVEDDIITLEIAPGVHARFVKGAIARVHTPPEPEPEEEPTGVDESLPSPRTDAGEPSEPTASEPDGPTA